MIEVLECAAVRMVKFTRPEIFTVLRTIGRIVDCAEVVQSEITATMIKDNSVSEIGSTLEPQEFIVIEISGFHDRPP